jgi:hypothetical protein
MGKKSQRQVQEGKPTAVLINQVKRRNVKAVGLEVWTALLLFLMAVDLASWHGALVCKRTSVATLSHLTLIPHSDTPPLN